MTIKIHVENYPDFTEFGSPPCSEVDPEIFYPQETDNNLTALYKNEAEAKSICKSCPYMVKCLDYAIKNSEMGIWGGTTEGQRKKIRQQMKIAHVTLEEIAVRIKR